MSDSISKYHKNLEDKKWWKEQEDNKTKLERVRSFISKLFNF